MQAIEFEADAINGTIELPVELKNRQLPLHLRIIAMFDDSVSPIDRAADEALQFPSKVGRFPLNWSKSKLTREQMNER